MVCSKQWFQCVKQGHHGVTSDLNANSSLYQPECNGYSNQARGRKKGYLKNYERNSRWLKQRST
ncbi:26S protease regulatory subunit 10B [Platysternon megacephalum]|uniref:26S protease regulatory subunit 10B n=1 Tax=Platysternon megacephalum TaxID=55544 RepID=A0A4D9E9B4_9SAUR|nr:26S protease regulatory subunit 10B [Platysternon megacephalum]